MSQPLPDPWSWVPEAPARLEIPVAVLSLEGPDTLRFLHGQSSQALEGVQPGQVLGTCCLTPTARVLALAEVLVREGGAWLVITAGAGAPVRAALDRVLFPADDVRLGSLEEAVLVEPVGNATAGSGATPPSAPADRWAPLAGGGIQLPAGRVLLAAGATLPPWLAEREPLAPAQAERLRIQRGIPAAPGEVNDGSNPFELGLADRVSLTKGCYVGQETLARLATYDGVKQMLRRWHAPAAGPGAAEVLASGAVLREATGERAGTITSALPLPPQAGGGGQGWIGLALVRRGALGAPELLAGEGSSLTVRLSRPDAFVPPPVGAGGKRSDQAAGGGGPGSAEGPS